MNTTEIETLYVGENFSVALLPGEKFPSLVLNHSFVENLFVALGLVDKNNPSSRPDIDAGSFEKLRVVLEPAIHSYGREYIEWMPNYPMSQEAKDASIEVRDAFRALERFNGK